MKKSEPVKVVVKQDTEKPIPVELIAQAIIDISEAVNKALNAGLTREAIVTLIWASSGVGKSSIRAVLDDLANLRRKWCREAERG